LGWARKYYTNDLILTNYSSDACARGRYMSRMERTSSWDLFYRLSWSGWSQFHTRRAMIDLRQRQRWSLITFLYLSVRSLRLKGGWKVMLTWSIIGALSRNVIRRVCWESSATDLVLMNLLSQSASPYCVCLLQVTSTVLISSDWWYTVSVPTIPVTDAVSLLHQCLPFLSN
jgi:hypothetical protein